MKRIQTQGTAGTGIRKKRLYKILFMLIFFVNMTVYAQEINDNDNENFDDYDFETAVGITVYAERPKEFDSESKNAYVLNKLNGSMADRKQFIETDFLEKSGFLRTANVKYRETNAEEKTISLISGVFNMFTFGLIPIQPFYGIEYDKLPKGELYKFESVFVKSNFKDVTPEVLTVMELEYMLQIEFRNGVIIRDNIHCYTDENINKFEKLILDLPDLPESIYQTKNRYLNELKKIKTAFERYRNPSENYLRALQNIGNSFNRYSNR